MYIHMYMYIHRYDKTSKKRKNIVILNKLCVFGGDLWVVYYLELPVFVFVTLYIIILFDVINRV